MVAVVWLGEQQMPGCEGNLAISCLWCMDVCGKPLGWSLCSALGSEVSCCGAEKGIQDMVSEGWGVWASSFTPVFWN